MQTRKQLSILIFLIFYSSHFLHSADMTTEANAPAYTPLYAGTMLAYFSSNIDPGRLAVQPYLFKVTQPGIYNSEWSFKKQKTVNELSLLLLLETGITRYLDITLILNGNYNWIGHNHSFLYEDTRALLGIQILRDQRNSWIPDLRVLIGESFPTGKYDHLNPNRLLSDSSGTGSYETSWILVSRKIFYIFPKHPFNININLSYTIATKTDVKGYSVYGGSTNTKGQVHPGSQFLANLAVEYSLTRNWVLGLDTRYLHQSKSHFKSKKGSPYSENDNASLPSSELISLAPCLEYNWNENFGLLGGVWFSVAGRNAQSFQSGIVSVYYEF